MTNKQYAMNFVTYQNRINHFLEKFLLPATSQPERLHAAMRYAVLAGGKRIRPLLVYATGEIFNTDLNSLDHAAAAIECMHCYSLIHDDLPAMDNDDLRRGQPTCHKAFDEATAILAGDALQGLAFKILSELHNTNIAPTTLVTLLRLLADASGSLGMCGGQMLDLQAENNKISLQQLETMHRLKTGALIRASVELGAHLGNATEEQLLALREFATAIGLAFQIQDDILDVESSTQQLGKQQGADVALAKSTYVSLLGLPVAKEYLQQTYATSIAALDKLSVNTNNLRRLAEYIVIRTQ